MGFMKTFLATVLFWTFMAISPFVSGQILQSVRYEVELEESDNYFEVISAGEKGLVLVREIKGSYKKGKVEWEMVYLDSMLNEIWADSLPIEYNFKLRGYDFWDDYVYVLFERSISKLDILILLRVNIQTRYTRVYNIPRSFPIDLKYFEMINKSVILGGYVNTRPTVMIYDLNTEQTKILPGFYMDRSDLLQLEVNNQTKTIKVLTNYRTFDKKYTISLKSFNENGEMLTSTELDPDERWGLISGRFVTVDSDFEIIAGTYATRKSEYSRGIFIARIEKTGEQNIKYYNYADLENFFEYMKAKRRKRVKNRIERKKIKGKRIRFNYRLLVHDIIQQDDSYVLLGEAYYPKYNNAPNNYSYYGYTSTPRYSVGNLYFEGYRYTHAIVIGIDKSGNIIWDNSFEINDIITMNLEQYVEVSTHKNEIVLLYNFENVIRSKIIQDQNVIEGKAFNDISLKFDDDVVKSNVKEFGDLEHWYGDRFFAYGVQKIKNLKDIGILLNREVFFINKIIYQ